MKKHAPRRNILLIILGFGVVAAGAAYALRGDKGTALQSAAERDQVSLSDLEGKSVAIVNSIVRSQISNQTYLIQVEGQSGVLVAVLNDDMRGLETPPQTGDRLSLGGMVRRLPPADTMTAAWGLSEERADALRREAQWYFDITEARPAPSAS